MGNMPLPVETDRVFSTGYEDFYQDTNPNLEQPVPEGESAPGDQSVDGENPVLRFRQPTYNYALLDYALRRTTVQLSCRLHGMFFTAAPPPGDGTVTPAAFPELTCYRRNLYSISGSITLPRSLRYILTDHGERIPIIGQELQISATESNEGGPVKLIIIPWKTSIVNNIPVSEPKGDFPEPAILPLDIVQNQDMDADFATFPIAWKRMQFRVATANNGRRRELQQHFTLKIKLVATLATGVKLSVAEAKSNSIIVRGRSPRNFATRKEQPVGGEKGGARKQSPTSQSPRTNSPPKQPMQPPAGLTRRATGETSAKSFLKRERSSDGNAFTPFEFNLKDQRQSPTTTTSARIPAISTPTLPSSKSTSASISPPPGANATLPQPLSLTSASNFKRSPAATNTTSQRPSKRTRTTSVSESPPQPSKRPSLPAPLSATKSFQSASKIGGAAVDPADLLYEYFPLGMDEWMAPVDAVYRPHVVHHTAPMATGGPAVGPVRPAMGAKNQRNSSRATTTLGLGLAGVTTSSAS